MKRSLLAAAVLLMTATAAMADLPQWMIQAQQPVAKVPPPPAVPRALTPQECATLFKAMSNPYLASQGREAALELARNRGCLR